MAKRGKAIKGVKNMSVPTKFEKHDEDKFSIYNHEEVKYIIFEDMIFDKYRLDRYLRNNGSRKFFQCLDVLFDNTDPLLFVEVGGCTGGMIKSFIAYDKATQVFCVEPNASLACQLRSKFGKNVDIENIGLGSVPGKGVLHITQKPEYSSRLYPNKEYTNNNLLGRRNKYKDGALDIKASQEFDIWKGDDYFAKKGIKSCDVVSLNTQGTELDILMGFQESLKNGLVKAFKIEIDMQCRYEGMNNSNFARIDYLMNSNGYRIFEILQISNLDPVGILLMDILYVHESIDIAR